MSNKEQFFIPENEIASSIHEEVSASGEYKLIISNFETRAGSWNYSQGKVFRQGSDQPIAIVQRNYCSFPFLFIENHPKGDFLVCGEDYQGQTIINLLTGERQDKLSSGADKGHGFCWTGYKFFEKEQLLLVDGCYWACPYEYQLFDFSDPMNGWAKIELPEGDGLDIPVFVKEPEFLDNGNFVYYETRYIESETDEEEEELQKNPIVDIQKTYRREGNKLILIDEWVSDYELDLRKKREEYRIKNEQWTANFKATDPLYLAYQELITDPALDIEEYISIGITYENWCPDFKKREKCWCRRIVKSKSENGWTVDLDWAVETGPIKLQFFKDGKAEEAKFFPHTVEAMHEAFEYTKKKISQK